MSEQTGAKARVGHGFYRLCRQLCIPAMVTLTGVRYFNIPDSGELEGALLIASNHQSYLDPVLVGIALSRPINYLARISLFRFPGFAGLLRAVGTHPVQRGGVGRKTLETVLSLLRGGEVLLIFPEGTRTHNGALARFKSGVSSIAVRHSVRVLPVCIEGAYQCWPRHRRLPRPHRVAVAFGDIINPGCGDARALSRLLTSEIEGMQSFLRTYLYRQRE